MTGRGTDGEMRPRVSVLMCVYNGARYLRQAMESVLRQDEDSLELIVVDDGSTDDSLAVADRLAGEDPRVEVAAQDHDGQGKAMNHALGLARAEYIAVLDSDDVMEPERLRLQAEYLDTHTDIAAVGSQFLTIDTGGRVTGLERHPIAPDEVRTSMFLCFSLHHPTILMRKGVALEAGGYDEHELHACRDYELFVRLLLRGHRLANLPQVLTRWRLNPAGMTFGSARPQTRDALDIRRRAFAALAQRDPAEADRVAQVLIRTHPTGGWFEDKVRLLFPGEGPSPVLERWRRLAETHRIPELEALAVEWLNDEPAFAEPLAGSLQRSGYPWLATLCRARAGGPPPERIPEAAWHKEMRSTELTLSLLAPTSPHDEGLRDRLERALAVTPPDSEVLVFATCGDPREIPDLPSDPRIRLVDTEPGATPGAAWDAALRRPLGRYVAYLEKSYTQHPDFLTAATTALETGAASVAFAPADRYYRDALNARGQPYRDPSYQPAWTLSTVLGRNRARLGGIVHRREVLADLAVLLPELPAEPARAIARAMLSRHPILLLKLRNREYAEPLALRGNILREVERRLVGWYLDHGLGALPASYAWSCLGPAQAANRLRALDRAVARGELPVHPGNLADLVAFAVVHAPSPLRSRTFRHLLRNRPNAVVAALREHRRSLLAPSLGLSLCHRLGRRLQRRNGARTTPFEG